MRWTELPVVAFDTETTGLDHWRGDRVIEFAAVVFHLGPDGRPLPGRTEEHSFLFNPGMPIPRQVQELTGITDADVAKAPPFERLAPRIHELLREAVTVAHNYAFDRGFLEMEFHRAGLSWPEPLAAVDTVDLSRRFFPEATSHKLGDLVRRLDIELQGAHRAVNDARACGLAFLALARRFQAPAELDGLIDWADATGRPPEGSTIRHAPEGLLFAEGPYAGERIDLHPEHLAWMLVARERSGGEWRYRYPDSLRAWIARWLRIRAAGRAPAGLKHLGPGDWGIDSCALPDVLEP